MQPGVFRAVRKVVLFLQRQGVHVGAQADHAFAAAGADDADHAGFGQSAMYFDTVLGELARQRDRRCASR
jgi:hypothetical protein